MSESLFLSPGSHGQVAELTGAHTRAGQIGNLVKNGTRHTINASGWPVVPLSAIDGSQKAGEDPAAWRSKALDRAA